MEILTRKKCLECGGTGWVTHPILAAFQQANQTHYDEKGFYMGTIKEAQWFASNGYKKRPIVDRIKCNKCQSTGFIQSWAKLSKFKNLTNTGQ